MNYKEMKKLARKVNNQVQDLFIPTDDDTQFPDSFDDWRSYADQVERGEKFRDDCDGYCLTCAELLIRAGADPRQVKVCDVKVPKMSWHLVCAYGPWVLDNLFRYVYYWKDANYYWRRSMKMSEAGIWRIIDGGVKK